MDDANSRRERELELGQLPSHRLAFRDLDFLARAELRSYRLGLEYAKTQLLQREAGVVSTIVVFGSARIRSPESLAARLAAAKAAVAEAPDDAAAAAELESAQKLDSLSGYYEEARRFATLATDLHEDSGTYEFVITTGGGPGIMEAANRGASESGGKTMGLNIEIPFEQTPNAYISPELCFNFHYFALRKMHFLLKARALVIFPGGFGTLDELFDALTLIQTGKMKRIPIVMFGREFWREIIDFDALARAGTVSPQDLDLISWADTAEDAWKTIHDFWGDEPPPLEWP
jgi:uncharacterized protein (TIGR00730 family)